MGNEEILIVGAGPTGMTAAIELTRAGFPVRVIDKSDHLARWSQALVVQARTLEQFQRYGIEAETVRRGRKLSGGRMFSDGKEIAHLDLSRIASCFPYVLFIPQSETEGILNGHMESMGVKTERGVELLDLEQHDGHVRAQLRHGNGQVEAVEPRWLLGCDGAHSTARQLLNIPFEGKAIELNFILGDLLLQGPDVPGDELAIHFHHGGDLVFMARLSDRVTRLIVATHGEQDTTRGRDLTREDFQKALDRCGIRAQVLDADWMTPFCVNDRQAAHYRSGSVFLAGDASHIHSPVGGQGMNTGIQDVANLAWKIAAVSRGGHAELLDTYEEERGEVGRHLLQFTERVLRFGTSPNRWVEALRDGLMPFVTQMRSVQKEVAGFISETAIHYRSSSAVFDYGGDGDLRAGDRLPDLTWSGGAGRNLLSDWTEPIHLLLVHNGNASDCQELQSGLRHGRVVAISAPQLENEGRRLLGAEKKLVIVRPDGYVGFRGPLSSHEEWSAYLRQDALT